jgi:hypothetical protein
MNKKELEQLKKKSIMCIELSNLLKEQVIQKNISNIANHAKKEVKKTNIALVIFEIND